MKIELVPSTEDRFYVTAETLTERVLLKWLCLGMKQNYSLKARAWSRRANVDLDLMTDMDGVVLEAATQQGAEAGA